MPMVQPGRMASLRATSKVNQASMRSYDEESFWDARLKRHRAYMRQVVEAQIPDYAVPGGKGDRG